MRWLRSIRLNWGLRPQTPGIYRLRARMAYCGGGRSRLLPFRLLNRRSGCVPALPYPPLRYFQSGSHQPRRAMIFHRAATNPLNFLSHWRGSPHLSPLAPLSTAETFWRMAVHERSPLAFASDFLRIDSPFSSMR